MKRILHALAALWPKGREHEGPWLPDARNGLLRHAADVMRMDGAIEELLVGKGRLSSTQNQQIPNDKEEAPLPKREILPIDESNSDTGNALSVNSTLVQLYLQDARVQNQPTEESTDTTSEPNVKRHYPMPLMSVFLALFMCLLAVQQVSAQSEPAASAAFENIKPLQIGDTIPEELWHLPLQVVNHPEGKETITLNEHRGKIILLDFLSTGCPGCISAIPKMEAVMIEVENEATVLPITPQTRDHVAAFIPKNKHVNNTGLTFIVEDEMLKKHFPHLYISHVVWVDVGGVVRAMTGTNHVSRSTISEFQSGIQLDWPVKTENTPFFNAPLITLQTESDILPNNLKRLFHYAVITGYTEGVGPYVATKQDSVKGIERVSYRNRTILDLYLIAVDRLYKLKPHQIVLEVAEPSVYTYSQAGFPTITSEQWYQRYAICYESTVSLGTPKSTQREYMLADLNRLLNLNGRLEVRNDETCFVLSEIEHLN